MRELSAGFLGSVMGPIGLVFWLASCLVSLPGPAAAQPIEFVVTPVLAPEVCITDFDQDGDVDSQDFTLFDVNPIPGPCPAGTCGWSCRGDFDEDCDVDEVDFAVFTMDFANPSGCTKVSRWRIVVGPHPQPPVGVGDDRVFAFAPKGPVIGVSQVRIVYANTHNLVPGFDFESTPNPATSGGFNLAADHGANFVGFLATVSQAIPSVLPVDLEFFVNAVPGATFEQIRDAYLGTPGPAPVSFAADEGDPSGNPTGNDQSFLSAASVTGISVPSMPVVGLAALASALLGVGLRRARHRRR